MKDYLPYFPGAVGLLTALLTLISVRIAFRGLAVTRITGQASFEGTRFSREPPLDLVLSSVTFRGPTKLTHDGLLLTAESEKWLKVDADHVEIVVQGRLRNNLNVELLLTFRDHPKGGRDQWSAHRHHNLWQLDGNTVNLGRTVLSAGSETTFTWTDRRPPEMWSLLRNDRWSSPPRDPALKTPRLHLSDLLLLARYPSISFAAALRAHRLPRIGFRIVAETRAAERLATIWDAEVTADLAEIVDWENNRFFDPADGPCTIQGPIDDDIIKYRVAYDPVLASIKRRRNIYLVGRD